MEVDEADYSADAGTSGPPLAKKMRSAVAEAPNPSDCCWQFVLGRIAVPMKSRSGLEKPVHLKDPKDASYTRNGKETSWRCSSKSCPAVIRKLKGDAQYKLYNYHKCKTKSHGPEDVPPIPPEIQIRLSYTKEQLMIEFGYDRNANSRQQQQE